MKAITIQSTKGKALFTHACENNTIKLTVEKAVSEGVRLEGAYLYGTYLAGAYLEGAYLEGANLVCSNLEGAYLEGADIGGARLWGTTGDQTYIKNIKTPTYKVCYTSDRLQIGCKNCSFKEWLSFSDQEIGAMDSEALSFWKENKAYIFDAIEANPAKPTK